jgi:leucyl aminopeptidase (aminopeptidase T)
MMCMKTCCCLALLGAAGIAALGFTPQNMAQTTAAPDPVKIARTLVNTCGAFQEGDIVLIEGGTRDQDVLEFCAIEVRKLGGQPLIVLGSERLTRGMFTDVPAKFDAQKPTLFAKLADTVDGMITIDFSEKPDLLADVDPQRKMTRARTMQAIEQKLQDRGVVQVHLGNDLYPTKARAERFGIPLEQLARIFWEGVNTDYKALQATGTKLQKALAAGNTLHITAPNGTDLTVKITQRPVFVSDGVVSYDDRTSRGPATTVWLPAGEVYVTPVPGTATGTFVADNFYYEGKPIQGFTMQFENGTLKTFTAKSGDLAALKKAYEAAPTGKDQFAAIDFGINPNIIAPPGSRMTTWVGAGTISVGFGGNKWAGGDNTTPFDVFAHLTNGTCTVDGAKIIDNGNLVMK